MTQQVADMSAGGVRPKEIIQFLSRNGQLGMITAHKVEHIRATVLSDLDTYTVRPKKMKALHKHSSTCLQFASETTVM